MNGARSVKPGNICLNWKKLLIDGAEGLLTIAGTINMPWLIPLAGLIIWDKVWSSLNIKMDERHAAVMWVMWNNRDERNCVKEELILDFVNREFKKYNRPEISEIELRGILEDLIKMGCIEDKGEDQLWLREWVRVAYE